MRSKITSDQLSLASVDGELFRLARCLVHGQDSEDLVQDTLVTALSQVQPPRRFGPWIKKVLRSRFHDHIRRSQRRIDRERRFGETHVPQSEAPEEAAFREELSAALRSSFDALPPRQQRVLLRRFVDDATPTEIAAEEQCRPATIRWYLHDAIRRMREEMDRHFAGRDQWRLGLMGLPGLTSTSNAETTASSATATSSADAHNIGTNDQARPSATGRSSSTWAAVAISAAVLAVVAGGLSSLRAEDPRPAARNDAPIDPNDESQARSHTAQERSPMHAQHRISGHGQDRARRKVVHASAADPNLPDDDHCRELAIAAGKGEALELQVGWKYDEHDIPVLDAEVRVSTKCDTTGNADGVTGCEHKRQRVVHPELAACVEFLLPNDAPEVLQRASGSEPAGFTLLIPATKYCGDHCPAWDTDDGSPLPDPEDGFAQQSIDQLATRSSSLRLGAASPDFTIVTCTRFGSMEQLSHEDLRQVLDEQPRMRLLWIGFSPSRSADAAFDIRAGIAARNQDRFWEMHELLNTEDLIYDRITMIKLARALQLDINRFEHDLDARESLQQIANNRAWCRSRDFRGTPSLLVGDLSIRGYWGPEHLRSVLADAI